MTKTEEVKKSLYNLGYREGTIELKHIDDTRSIVFFIQKKEVGIFDFLKKTFVD